MRPLLPKGRWIPEEGAWIASARKSYAGYLIRRLGTESDLALGFTDAQGKVVYELTEGRNWEAHLSGEDPSCRATRQTAASPRLSMGSTTSASPTCPGSGLRPQALPGIAAVPDPGDL